MTDAIAPLRSFVASMTRLVDRGLPEAELLLQGRELLAALIADDRWLPQDCAVPHPDYYQQYLLHCDPLERFSVVSFVWGPGQCTPVHDHTVWGLIGMLRGAETARRFVPNASGRLIESGAPTRLDAGQVDAVSPRIGDVHRVANAFTDRTSVSVHVYGGNIGGLRRHVFDADTGSTKPFVSGYSSAHLPNLWDRSADMRQGAA